MFERSKRRSEGMLNALHFLLRHDVPVRTSWQNDVYDAETLTQIGEAALLDGGDPNKILESLGRASGTRSVKKLAAMHGRQDSPV